MDVSQKGSYSAVESVASSPPGIEVCLSLVNLQPCGDAPRHKDVPTMQSDAYKHYTLGSCIPLMNQMPNTCTASLF